MGMLQRSIMSPEASKSGFSSIQPAAVLLLLLQLIGFMVTTTCSSSQRIAEGETTTLGQYPSVLSLGLTSWSNVYHLHYCSGSILTESWVITTAQCVQDAVEDVSRYYWLAGTNNLRQKGSQHRINRIVIHPGYNPNDSYIHDVALVQVKHPFEFSATIQPIELTTSVSSTSSETSGVIVGWGEISQTLIQPDVLRSADVTIIDVDICRGIYAPWKLNIDGEYQFCAITSNGPAARVYESENIYGGKNFEQNENEIEYDHRSFVGDRSACRGDEGGPFFNRGANFPFAISGIVTWTYGCSPSGYPAVYVKISAYLQWITENTGYW